MVKDVTIDLENPGQQVQCTRRDILNKLNQALKVLEEPAYEFPVPKAILVGEKCECRGPAKRENATFSITSCLDGADGVPNKISTDKGVRWSPKYPTKCQNIHLKMGCFCEPQVLNPDECGCPASRQRCPPKKPAVAVGESDYCTSGQKVFHCPPDSKHNHWTPYRGSCVWPKPCPAQCFDHSDLRDWIDTTPPR